MRRRFQVVCVYPPIPMRRFDWCAYFDGEAESGRYGWGETAEAAVAALFADHGEYEL
jgi:hypothetical protein